MKYTLEGHKLFPYIAWTVVLGFVVFTYTLTIRLSDATSSLEAKTEATVSAVRNGE
ncbi:hypothetical protein N8083_01270 [Candidatus Pacebacteria bacterium]|nr:hypothetical protein [Candidatus Paceibacterota bacterium]